MPADLAELKGLIEAALPGSEVEMVDEGGGDHLRETLHRAQGGAGDPGAGGRLRLHLRTTGRDECELRTDEERIADAQ